jgi:hypothetical protein
MQYDTMEDLFKVILSAQESGADVIKTECDPDHGFPTSIGIDFIEMALDDKWGSWWPNSKH